MPTPWGSATSSCGGRGRWPPAPPRPRRHPHHPRVARPARPLPARAARPIQRAERDLARARLAAADTGRTPPRRSRPRSPGCASTPPLPPRPRPARPRRATCSASATMKPPGRGQRGRVASPSGCAASRCSTARAPSSPPPPVPRRRDDGANHRPADQANYPKTATHGRVNAYSRAGFRRPPRVSRKLAPACETSRLDARGKRRSRADPVLITSVRRPGQ